MNTVKMKAFQKHLHNNPITRGLRKQISFSRGCDKPKCDLLTVVKPFARAWRVLQFEPSPFKTAPRNPRLRSAHHGPASPARQLLLHDALLRRRCQPAPCDGACLGVNERNFNQRLQMKMLITLHFLPTWKHTYIHPHLPQTPCTLDTKNKQKIPGNIFFDTFYIFAESDMTSWNLPTYI